MDTMQAIRAHRRGGPEQLHLEQAPIPVPEEHEVLIQVHAAAITYDELSWDKSWTRDGVDRTPIIPSHEVSGTVTAVGGAASDLAIGDDVFGLIQFDRDGAAAEFVIVPADQVALKPSSISHAEAASLPLAALTAWQALVDHAKLSAGESVLVTGGAGGVGAYVVQLARHLGAHVSATVNRGGSAEYVQRLGATDVSVRTMAGTFDVVVDTVGGPALAAVYDNIRDGGRLITLGAPPGPELKQGRLIHDEFFVVRPNRAELEHLATLVDTGALKPLVAATFGLADTAAAYADRGRHSGPGKTVIVVR